MLETDSLEHITGKIASMLDGLPSAPAAAQETRVPATPLSGGVACLVHSLAPNMRGAEILDLLERAASGTGCQVGARDAMTNGQDCGRRPNNVLEVLLGIPVLLEVERATGTQEFDAGIRRTVACLNDNPVGRNIVGYISARRLDLLAAIQTSKVFCETTARILRVLGNTGVAVDAGMDVSLPDEIWQDLNLVWGQIKNMRPIVAGAARQ